MDTEALCNDFLWYSYFGENSANMKKDNNRALSICINRAYRDMSRSLGFTFKSSDLENNETELQGTDVTTYSTAKKDFREDPLRGEKGHDNTSYSSELLKLISIKEDGYDKAHEALCDRLVKAAKSQRDTRGVHLFEQGGEERGFTCGHAQKWINMTIKYMLMAGNWANEFTRLLPALHIPIDNYVIHAAKAKETEPIIENGKVKGLGIKTGTVEPWSKISVYASYLDFQIQVRNALNEMSPIEWEAQAWIAQAMKEASKS